MITSTALDTVFVWVMFTMWVILLYHAVLAVRGYGYFKTIEKKGEALIAMAKELPYVSVLVPAKNEGKVLEYTLDALLDLEYPKDRIEIIVIDDGSTDNTKDILDRYVAKFRRVKPVRIPGDGKFHGKAAALNEGLKHASYDYIAVYDADNLPEKMALQYLVREILADNKLAAVCGKVRTFNRNKNILTKFINIEFIAHQWLLQAGRWKAHEIAIIPGTNYVMRKDVLVKVGGWDTKALTEDMELSLRLCSLGYKISFLPLAVTWEQEPESWAIWRKQRLRWIQGNKYIIDRFLTDKTLRAKNFYNFLYMLTVYFVLVLALIFSDIVFICGLFNIVRINVAGPLVFIWFFAFIIFTLEVIIALTFEVGEDTWTNFGLVVLMYFTYCQQWLYIAAKSFLPKPKKDDVFWTKTERF